MPNTLNPEECYAVVEDKVNAQSTMALWEKMEAAHPGKGIVHICDNITAAICSKNGLMHTSMSRLCTCRPIHLTSTQ
jgi:hypothetical protein